MFAVHPVTKGLSSTHCHRADCNIFHHFFLANWHFEPPLEVGSEKFFSMTMRDIVIVNFENEISLEFINTSTLKRIFYRIVNLNYTLIFRWRTLTRAELGWKWFHDYRLFGIRWLRTTPAPKVELDTDHRKCIFKFLTFSTWASLPDREYTRSASYEQFLKLFFA